MMIDGSKNKFISFSKDSIWWIMNIFLKKFKISFIHLKEKIINLGLWIKDFYFYLFHSKNYISLTKLKYIL